MSKKEIDDLSGFVDGHPSTLVADLLQLLSERGTHGLDQDVISAYLLRIANSDGVPESIRSIALQIYKDWDLEAVSASAASVILTLGGILH